MSAFLQTSSSRVGPSRRTLVLFLVVGLLCLAQLGWWLVFHLRETELLVRTRRELLLAQRYEAAALLAGRPGLQPGPVAEFPDLMLQPAGADGRAAPGVQLGLLEVAVRPERLEALVRWRWDKTFMFVSEGVFFALLLLAGLGLIW